ncbi:hypothetical protein [Falsihalocynthiibacter arcticus]|uniref:Uncharacterized protein n=1 Tax=Falsihalocynthiibacter arcticus TaxID=1579316 RepID=A0A126UZW8_9RHOB|nr:hypothetical protein [Falsihalocynthiibacter arcticus]AML51176.1 hypothetical protein RC74_07805 [Falsihalocynthiibacter arcticus]
MNSHLTVPTSPFRGQKFIAVVAMLFGALTLFSAGNVLFGSMASQAWAGNYVGFVVWFNFLAGAAYILAAIGLWQGTLWAARLSGLIAIATAGVALGFAFVVLLGTPFEMRTIGALVLRFTFWAVIAVVATRAVKRG